MKQYKACGCGYRLSDISYWVLGMILAVAYSNFEAVGQTKTLNTRTAEKLSG
ncbi:hypothetical protein AB4145_23240 [Vibrio splendidus]